MDISNTTQALQALINTTQSQSLGYGSQTQALQQVLTTVTSLNNALVQANLLIVQLGGLPVVAQGMTPQIIKP